MKPRKGWKVVSLWRDKQKRSCMAFRLITAVVYSVGNRTAPEPGAGPLCVFSEKRFAEDFIKLFYNPKKLRILPCRFLPSNETHVYNDRYVYALHISQLPTGTVLADWVELTEE